MMKFYTLILALFTSCIAIAQSKQNLQSNNFKITKETNVHEKKIDDKRKKLYQNKLKQDAFFIEDFSNGFNGLGNNGKWTQFGKANDSTGVTPLWEYRGINTTPNINIGSRGSCAGTNGIIQSETVDNGFVIFDSNWWDEPASDSCAGLGKGLSPRPHHSALVSPSIDLSQQSEVKLYLTTYSRNFLAALNLYVLADGDTTFIIDIYDFINLKTNQKTETDAIIGIDITTAAAGKSDVKIIFDFVGDYYYCMIDDIYLSKIAKYDYSITDVYNDNINTNFEYNHLPLSQSHLIQPGISAISRGKEPVDLKLTVEIIDPVGDTLSFSKTVNQVLKDSSTGLQFIDTYLPTYYGTYTINFKVSSEFDSLEFDTTDNNITRSFIITNDRWSDAHSGGVSSYFAPELDGEPIDCEYFQLYKPFNNLHVTGFEYLIVNRIGFPDKATLQFDELKFTLYEIDELAFNNAKKTEGEKLLKTQLLTELTTIYVEVIDSQISTDGYLTLNQVYFPYPAYMQAGKLYAISVFNSGGGYLRVPVTLPNKNSDFSGMVRSKAFSQDPSNANNDELYILNNVNPWLRLSSNISVGVNSTVRNNHTIGNALPNPTSGHTEIPYQLNSQANVEFNLSDLYGKIILHENLGEKPVGNHKIQFNVLDIDDAIYIYTIVVNGQTFSKKLIVTK